MAAVTGKQHHREANAYSASDTSPLSAPRYPASQVDHLEGALAAIIDLVQNAKSPSVEGLDENTREYPIKVVCGSLLPSPSTSTILLCLIPFGAKEADCSKLEPVVKLCPGGLRYIALRAKRYFDPLFIADYAGHKVFLCNPTILLMHPNPARALRHSRTGIPE